MKLTTSFFILMNLLTHSAAAQSGLTAQKVFTTEVDTDKEAAKMIVELVKSSSLRAQYEKQMHEAFDFLDEEWRTDLASADNLEVFKLSQWSPSSSFRLGQGDYDFCNIDTEVAGYHHKTQLVGFDTSYKRETTYGFWGNFSVNVDWCQDENDQETKSRITIEFNKWIDADTVYNILF